MNIFQKIYYKFVNPLDIIQNDNIQKLYPRNYAYEDIKKKVINVEIDQLSFNYLLEHKDIALVLADRMAKILNSKKLVILSISDVPFQLICKEFPRLITNSIFTVIEHRKIIKNIDQISIGLIESPIKYMNTYKFHKYIKRALKKGYDYKCVK